MKKYNLDPFTFGNSLGAQNLVKYINNKPNKTKLGGLLALIPKYQKILKKCNEIKDKKIRNFVLDAVRDQCLKNISEIETDDIIISHAKNVIDTYYKKQIEKIK